MLQKLLLIVILYLFHMMKSASALKSNQVVGRGGGGGGRGGGGIIKMILSPAKTLDLSPWPPPNTKNDDASNNNDTTTHNHHCQHSLLLSHTTRPDCCPSKTIAIANAMKKYKQSELTKLLGISANIATTAVKYWNDFELPKVEEDDDDNNNNNLNNNNKPCIFAFSGAAYQGLQISSCSNESILYMQDNLRIIDPLYGALRPLDRIQPYRLEMATKGICMVNNIDDTTSNTNVIKLVDYWKETVTARLKQEIQAPCSNNNTDNDNDEHPVVLLLNLASDEYSAVVSAKDLPDNVRYIKVIFREQGRVIAVHAKRARGLMVRYLAEHQATTLDQVKAFNLEGYYYYHDACLGPEESNDDDDDDDDTLVFDREKQAAKGRATKKKVTTTTTTTSSSASSSRAKRSKR